MEIVQIGIGEFGPIYEGVYGKEAIDFLIAQGRGEIKDAFYHKDIGNIDLVWNSGEGKGLASIVRDHPSVIMYLGKIIENGHVYQRTQNRVRLIAELENKQGIAIIRLDFDGKIKTWILTGFLLDD